MLSGVETTKEKVLRIILAGQPELNQKLDAPELVQLDQRIRLRFHLGTLSPAEMHAYIHHRLEVAGAGDRQIFAEDTYARDLSLHRRRAATGQHPVRHGHAGRLLRRPRHVTAEDITEAVDELHWVEFAARPHHSQLRAATELAPPRMRRKPTPRSRSSAACSWCDRGAHHPGASADRSAASSSAAPPTTTCRSTAAS